MLSHKKSLDKTESLHKRALKFLLNDYVSSYEQLSEKSGKCNMKIRRLRFLCIEIYRTLNYLNPSFMKEIFEKRNKNRVTHDRYKLNLNIPRINQVTFGTKSLKFYGPKIWNNLPVNIKTAESLNAFKDFIKKWNGVSCNCIVCTHQSFIFCYYNKNIIMYIKILIICQMFYLCIFKQVQNYLFIIITIILSV